MLGSLKRHGKRLRSSPRPLTRTAHRCVPNGSVRCAPWGWETCKSPSLPLSVVLRSFLSCSFCVELADRVDRAATHIPVAAVRPRLIVEPQPDVEVGLQRVAALVELLAHGCADELVEDMELRCRRFAEAAEARASTDRSARVVSLRVSGQRTTAPLGFRVRRDITNSHPLVSGFPPPATRGLPVTRCGRARAIMIPRSSTLPACRAIRVWSRARDAPLAVTTRSVRRSSVVTSSAPRSRCSP
jgi:hypothetical protein